MDFHSKKVAKLYALVLSCFCICQSLFGNLRRCHAGAPFQPGPQRCQQFPFFSLGLVEFSEHRLRGSIAMNESFVANSLRWLMARHLWSIGKLETFERLTGTMWNHVKLDESCFKSSGFKSLIWTWIWSALRFHVLRFEVGWSWKGLSEGRCSVARCRELHHFLHSAKLKDLVHRLNWTLSRLVLSPALTNKCWSRSNSN